MRIIGDVNTLEIIQCGKTPDQGDTTVINGKFVFDIPIGDIPVTDSSFFYPTSNSVVEAGFNNLLSAYNIFTGMQYTALRHSSDLAFFDKTATVDNTGDPLALGGDFNHVLIPRYQTGSSIAPIGLVPNSTALLPENASDSTPGTRKPGLLATSMFTVPSTNNFLVYWKIYQIDTTHDVRSDYGSTAGQNMAAQRILTEVDQTFSGDFHVAISVDNGVSYSLVPDRMVPFTLAAPGTQVRLAFINTHSSSKIYLGAFALLY